MISKSAFIHDKATVDGSIVVGPLTRIWQNATVIRGTILGAGCNVGACANLDGPMFGNRCLISPHVMMGPGFKVGNDCFIGPSVTFCNDMWPFASKDNFDVKALQDGKKWAIIVGDRVGIGANAVILPGVRIGNDAVIAAGAVVDKALVPDGHLFRRNGTIVEIKPEWRENRMRFAS